MSDNNINVTAPLHAATKQGKLTAAREVFMDGDKETLQQIGEKTHQLENAVKDITATGGASTANAVSYSNETSGMTAVTAQGAIDELAAKNKAQDATIGTKAEKSEVATELDKKFNKENIVQEFGDSKDKVVSQFVLPFREIESPEFIKVIVDANNHLLFSINLDGEVDWAKGIPAPIRAKLQEIITQCQQDKTDLLGSINTINGILDKTTIKDEEGNVQDTPFRIIENEEFIHAVTDGEDNLLFGIRREDGKPYFPLNDLYHVTQNKEFLWVILDAASHPLLGIKDNGVCWAAKAQWLDDIKAIKEALDEIPLEEYVKKEEGKGLTNTDVAESLSYISNKEFVMAVVDSEDRVLCGIKSDGNPYFPDNDMYNVVTNVEWLHAIVDAEGKLLCGLRSSDGHLIVGGNDINELMSISVDIQSIKESIGHLSLVENVQYLAVETDAEGKMLSSTNADGSHYIHKVKSETIPTEFEHIEDPEGRTEITTDAEGRVLAERREDGEKHEVRMDIDYLKVSNLNLQGNSVNDIMDALKANEFDVKHPMDWSGTDYVQIPIPRCAKINLITDTMPTAKSGMGVSGVNCDIPCHAQFWDMQGNYFNIPILLSAQGDSSMAFPKKNLAIDMFHGEDRNDSFSVKFGDWVAQDSYHLKAYYTDFFRGVGAVSYMLYEEMANTRAIGDNRPYKHLYTSLYQETDNGGSQSIKELDKNMDTGAKCFPQGFPVIVYQNGEFYGVYSWQLKKHRDNMHQDKKTAEHIHLDGTLGESTIFGGKINWSAFEVRNPKNLYYQEKHTINGKETLSYNGDYPFEIMGKDSEFYNASNKDMVRCAKVKGYIVDLSNRISELNQAVSDGKANDEIKELIDKYFNVSFLIDYILETNLGNDGDGYNKNWQWTTYNGTQWNVNPYDHDGVFGGSSRGTYLVPPPGTYLIGDTQSTPVGWVIKYFKQELNDRWKELRDKGVFETKHITSMLADWCSRIGYDNWKKEYAKWNESPCNRSSHLNDSYWSFEQTYVQGWSSSSTYRKDYIVAYDRKGYRSLVDGNVGNVPSTDDGTNWEDITYSEEKAYSSGDTCVLYVSAPYIFKCTEPCSGQPPVTKFYTLYPRELGHFDSIYRVQRWIEGRMSSMDKVLEYTNN